MTASAGTLSASLPITFLDAGSFLTGVLSAGTLRARPGDLLTFALVISNAGPSDALAVVATAALPAGTQLAGTTWNSTRRAMGDLTWSGDIEAGASRELPYCLRVITMTGSLAATATISGMTVIPLTVGASIVTVTPFQAFLPLTAMKTDMVEDNRPHPTMRRGVTRRERHEIHATASAANHVEQCDGCGR